MELILDQHITDEQFKTTIFFELTFLDMYVGNTSIRKIVSFNCIV